VVGHHVYFIRLAVFSKAGWNTNLLFVY
jgi:hypothetical protein